MWPGLYVNCQVDLVAELNITQVLDSGVNYVLDADFNDPSTTWTVFAINDDNNPLTIPDNSYVHVTGYIDDSVGAYNSLGGYIGNVAQLHVANISIIS